MKLLSRLIAGVLGIGMLVGAGAASAAPTVNLAKPEVTSSVEQVRDHRGHHSRKHWKQRNHHKRHHWRSDRRHRDHRWQAHRYHKRNYYRGHHRYHGSRWHGPASSNR